MPAPGTIERELIHDDEATHSAGWLVTVYNNEENTYDEVITILMIATGCDLEEAEIETWEIDHLGKSVVHQAGREECENAASIIAKIGIRVEVHEG